MALHVPSFPQFLWYLASQTGQPAGAFGASVTPGNNAYGSYTELIDGALVTEDVWFIRININSNDANTVARDALLTLGIDPSAGTAYTDLMSHLLCSAAQPYATGGGGHFYDFPFYIPAGSSIAVKASVNNATVGTLRCWVQLWGRPRFPEVTPRGTIFRTFGEVTASSRGTLVTPGTTAEGAWVQLGSATVEPLWWWEFGYGVNDADLVGTGFHVDIGVGDATTKRNVINDARVVQTGGEQISKAAAGEFNLVAAGDLVYGRMQGSAGPDTDHSLIAYGVG